MKIYLAGPLFTRAEYIFNEELAYDLKEMGFEVFLPQEECKSVLDSREIFNICKNGIEASDIIIAILDGADADSGTCWEVGFAYAIGVSRIIALRTDFRQTGDTQGFNAMLYNSATKVIVGNDAMLQFWTYIKTLKTKKAQDI